MSDEFWNRVKQHVEKIVRMRATARHGTVVGVDTTKGTVKVVWGADGTSSAWLPMVQPGGGGGWSVVCYPTLGTQVFGVPDMGDQSSMVVVGSVHSDQQQPGKITPYSGTGSAPPPQPITPGEVTLMHTSGASLRLTDGGVVEIHGTLRITGDVQMTGTLTAAVDVIAGGNAVSLATHRHQSFGSGSTTSQPI